MVNDITLGFVSGNSIGKVRGGNGQVQYAQAWFSRPQNVSSIPFAIGPGIDSAPFPGARVLYLDSGGNFKWIVGGSDIGVTPTAAPGEFGIYSTDGTQKLAEVKCNQAGSVFVGNRPTGNNLRHGLDGVATALTNLASALASAANLASVNAAGTALGVAITTAKAEIDLVLAAT